MRQLLPTTVDPVDPAAVYGDPPVASGRPGVRLNMIASVDGATTLAGVSGGLGGRADHELFAVLRSLADGVLVAAGTVRAERYGPSSTPVAVVSRSLRLDWDAPFFTAQVARPVLITVAQAPADQRARAGLLDELCLTLSPRLAGGDAKRILDGRSLPASAGLRLCSACEQDEFLFLRYRPLGGRHA